MKKRLSLLLMICMIIMLSAGCSSSDKPKDTTENTEKSVSEKNLRKINVGYGNHLGCSLWFIAKESGFFEEYGLDVELNLFDGTAEHLAAINSGQLFCGSTGGTATFQPSHRIVIFHSGAGRCMKVPESSVYRKTKIYTPILQTIKANQSVWSV